MYSYCPWMCCICVNCLYIEKTKCYKVLVCSASLCISCCGFIIWPSQTCVVGHGGTRADWSHTWHVQPITKQAPYINSFSKLFESLVSHPEWAPTRIGKNILVAQYTLEHRAIGHQSIITGASTHNQRFKRSWPWLTPLYYTTVSFINLNITKYFIHATNDIQL